MTYIYVCVCVCTCVRARVRARAYFIKFGIEKLHLDLSSKTQVWPSLTLELGKPTIPRVKVRGKVETMRIKGRGSQSTGAKIEKGVLTYCYVEVACCRRDDNSIPIEVLDV